MIWAFETSELRDPLFRLINVLHRENLLLNAYGLSEISIKASAHRLERLRPKFLMGYSHSMAMLADYLLTKGICPTKPTAIFTTTQTLLASQRRAVERAFGCEVYDLYSSREFSLMASECAEHVGYHIQSENVVLEFLKDGEPVSPGEARQDPSYEPQQLRHALHQVRNWRYGRALRRYMSLWKGLASVQIFGRPNLRVFCYE